MGAWEDFAAERFDLTDVNRMVVSSPALTPTGIAELDRALGGGLPEGVSVMMGAPGTGKSGVALYAAYCMARRGLRVAFVSLEMTQADCWTRLVSSHSVSIGRPMAWSRVEDASAWLVASERLALECPGLLVVEPDSCEADEVAAECMRAFDAGADVVMLDYMQYLEVTGAQSDYERVTHSSHALADVAKRARRPLVVLSSMGREGNRLKRPDMHCGAGSSAIEYDATTLTVMWRERDEDGDPTDRILMSVEKNRRGPTSDEPVSVRAWHAYNTYRE